jgi:hypothetical protein
MRGVALHCPTFKQLGSKLQPVGAFVCALAYTVDR